ncbi:MAG: MBL fold metallo-hydrolase [Myxococcota bacterium]
MDHSNDSNRTRRSTLLGALSCASLLALSAGCGDDSSTSDGATAGTTDTGDSTSGMSNASTEGGTDSGSTSGVTEGTDTTAADESDTSTGADGSAFDQAVDAVGGADALEALEGLQITASGTRHIDYEELEPGEIVAITNYSATYSFDVPNERFRVDKERVSLFEALQFFPPAVFSVVLDGNVGGLSAQAAFVPPGPMPSQHVGALWTQQRLLNPHFYLREGLADSSLVGEGGEEDVDGRPHRIVTFAGPGEEIRLFVDEETGFISKLETRENHLLVRDVDIEVRYADWDMRGSLAFPQAVELLSAGQVIHEETRTGVQIDPAFEDRTFDLPREAGEPAVDEHAFEFGQQSHAALTAFFSLIAYVDEEPMFMPQPLGPGLTLLAGQTNSLAVSYDEGLILLEAPTSPAHGTNLVESLETSFPGTPITHVVQSHYHYDRSSGVRSLVAAGATAVVGHGVGEFWDEILSAESTVRPDALASADVVPVVEVVAEDATFSIGDENVSVTAYHLSDNPHSNDMLITAVELGGQRYVYVGDLYNAGFGATLVLGGPESFFAGLRSTGLIDTTCTSDVPLTIVPSHGVPLSLADSLAELQGLGVDVGCPPVVR